jgi:hypothetical protein
VIRGLSFHGCRPINVAALRSQGPAADITCMKKSSSASWRVKKNGEVINILGNSSSVVAVLPRNNGSVNASIPEAYVIAAAPQLLEICTRLKSILENNLIVTSEGFKIDCSEIREDLLGAILRAKGCRKTPEEP